MTNSRNELNLRTLSYNELLKIVNNHDDVELCTNARRQLYYLIARDFLENFLKDDIFDESQSESYEIFKFFKDLGDPPADFNEALIDCIFSNDINAIKKGWSLVETDSLSLSQLAELICNCPLVSIQNDACDTYLFRVENELRNAKKENFEEEINSLLKICFECKNEVFVSESWRLLKAFEFFDDTYYTIVLNNKSPEIVEYAWKFLLEQKISEQHLIEIIRNTCSKPVAHQALDLFRKTAQR